MPTIGDSVLQTELAGWLRVYWKLAQYQPIETILKVILEAEAADPRNAVPKVREFQLRATFATIHPNVYDKPEDYVKITQEARDKQFEEMHKLIPEILKRDPLELEWLIAASVKLKAEVVSADEREGGLRRVLNLGHTIGHALEAETGYGQLLHGEAVAWGMIAATNIALTVGRTDSVTAGRIADAVLSLGRLPEVKVNTRKVLARLQTDKKTKDSVVHFVLPREIGKVEVVNDVPERAIADGVEQIRRLSRAGWATWRCSATCRSWACS